MANGAFCLGGFVYHLILLKILWNLWLGWYNCLITLNQSDTIVPSYWPSLIQLSHHTILAQSDTIVPSYSPSLIWLSHHISLVWYKCPVILAHANTNVLSYWPRLIQLAHHIWHCHIWQHSSIYIEVTGCRLVKVSMSRSRLGVQVSWNLHQTARGVLLAWVQDPEQGPPCFWCLPSTI